MRLIPLACIALLTLAFTAPAALADGPGSGEDHGKGKATSAEHRANVTAIKENHTADDGDDDAARHAPSNKTSDRENRTAAVQAFLTKLHALRASWLENATKIRETCHNATIDRANATNEQKTDWAHCIHDGYKSWRESHRAALRELREEIRQNMRQAGA